MEVLIGVMVYACGCRWSYEESKKVIWVYLQGMPDAYKRILHSLRSGVLMLTGGSCLLYEVRVLGPGGLRAGMIGEAIFDLEKEFFLLYGC